MIVDMTLERADLQGTISAIGHIHNILLESTSLRLLVLLGFLGLSAARLGDILSQQNGEKDCEKERRVARLEATSSVPPPSGGIDFRGVHPEESRGGKGSSSGKASSGDGDDEVAGHGGVFWMGCVGV
jgi:hypothetical protein